MRRYYKRDERGHYPLYPNEANVYWKGGYAYLDKIASLSNGFVVRTPDSTFRIYRKEQGAIR